MRDHALCAARPGARAACIMFAATLGGCASSSENIKAQYVSPMQYAGYDCEQIAAEQKRVSARVGELANEVDDNAAGDAAAVGVGLILFWPALFFVDGDGAEAAEYARLKGEHEALLKAAAEKRCAAPAETAGLADTATGTLGSGPRLMVTPTVKAKVERYIRNCEAQAMTYCVIAVSNDGTRAELAKAPKMSTSRQDLLRRSALNGCGGADDCVVVYDGRKLQMEIMAR